jgi:hypothetical protein
VLLSAQPVPSNYYVSTVEVTDVKIIGYACVVYLMVSLIPRNTPRESESNHE